MAIRRSLRLAGILMTRSRLLLVSLFGAAICLVSAEAIIRFLQQFSGVNTTVVTVRGLALHRDSIEGQRLREIEFIGKKREDLARE